MSAIEPEVDPAAGPVAGPAAEGFFLGPDEGDPFFWLGSLTINKLEGHSTHGGMDIVDHRVPAGYAPPLHVHRAQDEVFYVVDGLFTFHCGDRSWQAGPGSLGFLPRNVPHGYSVSANGPGRTLLINAPAGFAEVISQLGEPASELVIPGPEVAMPDPDRIRAVSEAHGIFGAPTH